MRYVQPQIGPARVDLGNPTTRGIQGLLWVGPNGTGTVDILNPLIPFTPGGVLAPTTVGVGRVATTAQTAALVPYSGNQAIQAPWKVPSTPVTLLAFFDPTGVGGSTSIFAGVTSGLNGLAIVNQFGTAGHEVGVNSVLLSVGGSWSLGPHVHGLVHTGAALQLIDSGKVFASTADATSAITYDASFTATQLLASTGGIGYWMAAWNRALSPAELASLEANPWQLFEDEQTYIPFGAASTPVLSSPTIYQLTSSGGYPRVTRA